MLRLLKGLLAALQPALAADAASLEHTLRLATAVMLLEVMRADGDFASAERRAVIDALRDQFGLADDEIAQLVEMAERAARDATDWFEFTSHINNHFGSRPRCAWSTMWRVAYADGHLSDRERHTLRRIADLLHVPHGAYINAKIRAKEHRA
jgi:uncharacterized tellurite resistance protein B-like protein